MEVIDVIHKLSTARLEYQSVNHSVWNQFVVPHFIKECDIHEISHSVALVGSRGCGKTTFIKYFSHATRFDRNRSSVEETELDNIVLYWKPDITLCRGLTEEWLGKESISIFSTHSSLELIYDLTVALDNIAFHFPNLLDSLNKGKNYFGAISHILKKALSSFEEIKLEIRKQRYALSEVVNNLQIDSLLRLEPSNAIAYLVESIRSDYPRLGNTSFKIFVDEFENLKDDQQKVINNYRKHSNILLNWNVAYKTKTEPTQETTSSEWLQVPDDFRYIYLDDHLRKRSFFEVYAAEIFLLHLQNCGVTCDYENLKPDFLGDIDKLKDRLTDKYRAKILNYVKSIIPNISIGELSELAIKEKALVNKLNRILSETQKISENQINDIIGNPELAITILGTHRQKSFNLGDIIGFLEGKQKEIKKIKEKIETYQFNSLLSLNLQNAYVNCPVYAGFDRFISMSLGNVRHFNELCYQSLKHFQSQDKGRIKFGSIEDFPEIQFNSLHEGAKACSSALVNEIINYPPIGRKLHTLITRIGELLQYSQKSTYQTEPERNIVKFQYDTVGADNDEIDKVFKAARSWHVLIEDKAKRVKDVSDSYQREFFLNPIYAAHFGISYRKMRDVSFSYSDFMTIVNGTKKEYGAVKQKFLTKWKVEDSEIQPGLFLDDRNS